MSELSADGCCLIHQSSISLKFLIFLWDCTNSNKSTDLNLCICVILIWLESGETIGHNDRQLTVLGLYWSHFDHSLSQVCGQTHTTPHPCVSTHISVSSITQIIAAVTEWQQTTSCLITLIAHKKSEIQFQDQNGFLYIFGQWRQSIY